MTPSRSSAARAQSAMRAGSRHSGAGAPRAKGGGEPGNLVVQVRVVVPKKLNKREKEILQALAEEQDEHVRERLLRKAREAEQR